MSLKRNMERMADGSLVMNNDCWLRIRIDRGDDRKWLIAASIGSELVSD